MPYMIQENSAGEYCVHKQMMDKSAGEKITCHTTEAEAKKHMAALYANVPDAGKSEEMTYYGSEVKALGNGRVSGYLVLFSTANDPDLQSDFFTKSTDFYITDGDQRPILYRHGMHSGVGRKSGGRGTLTVDDMGVFIEGELDLSDRYWKAIYKLAEQGKLGWSSGSLGHIVARTPRKKAFEVDAWPIGEASLTPNPVEPRTRAVPIKSFENEDEQIDLDEFVKSLEEQEEVKDFTLAGTPAIEQFCEDVAPASLKDGSERAQSAASAAKEFLTLGSILGEAYHSYTGRLVRRTENRFLKESKARPPDASTLAQVEQVIDNIDQVSVALGSVKEHLLGIRKLSELSRAEKKALDERARLELWNFCHISGTTPEELENDGSTS